MVKYVEMNSFEDMCQNQKELIQLLNHRMTGLESSVSDLSKDVYWIKALGVWMAGIVTTIAIKLLFFN